MKGIVITKPGGPEVLQLQDVPEPELKANHVIIKVAATAVNRADVMQRMGQYPPPPGSSELPGLECSGVIEAVGEGVSNWKVGEECCALLTGGGYAEKVAVPAGQVMPIPSGISLEVAGGLPEVTCTVWSTVFMGGGLQPGQNFLVHGGSSGIGTMAIQLAKVVGARVFCTAGSAAKLQRCKDLGADVTINYKDEDFVQRIKEETDGRGVDVILDNMGAAYLSKNLEALASDGVLIVIGLQGGREGQVNLGAMLKKRATIKVLSLRSRPLDQKAQIVKEVVESVWPLLASKQVLPIVDTTFSLAEASKAHEWLEKSGHIGKILLHTQGYHPEHVPACDVAI